MSDLSSPSITKTGYLLVVKATVGPFASAGSDSWNVQWKRGFQSWETAVSEGQYAQIDNEIMASAAEIEIFAITNTATSLDVRIQQVGVVDYDWHTLSYNAGDSTTEASAARVVSYKEVRDDLMERHGFTSPTAADYARAAQFITAANRFCVETASWPELKLSKEVAVTDGLVLLDDLEGADYFEFWTQDCLTEASKREALPITVHRVVQGGVYLNTKLTTVFVIYTRRAPVFKSTAIVAGTAYNVGDVRYDDASGDCLECISDGALGSDSADATKWRALPILWCLKEPLLCFAEAHFFSREQERGQASSLRNEGERLLDDLFRRLMIN